MTLLEFIQEQMANNEFFQGAALTTGIAGLVAATWGYFKYFLFFIISRIKRLVLYTVTVEDNSSFYKPVERYLSQHHSGNLRNVAAELDFDSKAFNTNTYWDDLGEPVSTGPNEIKDTKKHISLKYKHWSDVYYVWYNKRLITVNKTREQLSGGMNIRNSHKNYYSFTTLFGKKHLNKFLKSIADEETERLKNNKQPAIYFAKDGFWEMSSQKLKSRTLESVISDSSIKTKITKSLEQFFRESDWYYEMGIPYKNLLMLDGPPGNGKTSLIRAFASRYGRDVCYLNLGEVFTDISLRSLFDKIPSNSFVVIEDIDSFMDGRAMKHNKENSIITFSNFINLLDGIMTPDGLVMFITTNTPDTMDRALLRRVDCKITIENPTSELVSEYLTRFYQKDIKFEHSINKLSFSDIQGCCMAEPDPEKVMKQIIKLDQK